MRRREAGTSAFVCRRRTHVARTARKLVHTKRTLVNFYVVAGTVRKSGAHDVKFCLSLMTHEFKSHATCGGDNILSSQHLPADLKISFV